MNIIIVEDEGITALFLRESLVDLGHTVSGIFNNALSLFDFLDTQNDTIDLILMDINIEGAMDGLQISKRINLDFNTISIVFITSFKDSETINEAQSVKPLGYLVKPISEVDLETTLMIVQANKNVSAITNQNIQLSNYTYDIEKCTLSYKNQVISFSKNERLCIELLFKNTNGYISKDQLISYIWDDDVHKESSLRELIYRVRKKLIGLDIIVMPNIGYVLKEINN